MMNIKKREIFTKEMTQEQIDKAIDLLAIAIIDGKVEVKEPTNKKINLINEACYISSGQYIGLFFPNLVLKINGHEIVCVSYGGTGRFEGDYSLILIRKSRFEEIDEIDENLYYLVYNYDERNFYQECKNLKEAYQRETTFLKKIKQVKTAKGEEFKIFSKNFEGAKIIKNFSNFLKSSEINVGGYVYRLEGDTSADDVMTAINNRISFNEKKIGDLTSPEKRYHQKFKKIEEFTKKVSTFCNNEADDLLTSYYIRKIISDNAR